MNLQNKIFALVENENGLAASDTRMVFDDNSAPYQAVYSGHNVSIGHVLVSIDGGKHNMIYHAVDTNDALMAGKAEVSFLESVDGVKVMQLNWQWLTGDLSSGISLWHEIVD